MVYEYTILSKYAVSAVQYSLQWHPLTMYNCFKRKYKFESNMTVNIRLIQRLSVTIYVL